MSNLRRYETIFFVGHARLPENITAKHVYDVFGVEIEVDPRNNRVVDASVTAIPSMGEKFLLDLLVGHNLEEGIDGIIEAIERRYFWCSATRNGHRSDKRLQSLSALHR